MDRGATYFKAIKAQAGAGNSDVVAAVTGKSLFVQNINIAVEAYNDTGTVLLDDGTTTLWGPFLIKDDNGHPPPFHSEKGLSWGKGKGIRVVVANGGTVNVMVSGYSQATV